MKWYYLFWPLYRNAASYMSNNIDPPLIFILLSISSQNLHTWINTNAIMIPSYNTPSTLEDSFITMVILLYCFLPFPFLGLQHIHRMPEMQLKEPWEEKKITKWKSYYHAIVSSSRFEDMYSIKTYHSGSCWPELARRWQLPNWRVSSARTEA